MSKLFDTLKGAYLALTDTHWILGFMEFSEEFVLDSSVKARVSWVKTKNRKGWYADPFILDVTDTSYVLLVEDYKYFSRKANISRVTIDRRSMEVVDVTPVITGPTHLSFPAYFRDGNDILIYPESIKSGHLSMYRYNSLTGEVSKEKNIMIGPVADAVICTLGGRMVITGTVFPEDNGKVLCIYPYNPDGPEVSAYEPSERIEFPDCSARNAGMVFAVAGKSVRPAQNSNHFYGECLVFQEIVETDRGVEFKEIKRVYSPLRSYPLSFHTFNVYNDIAVVDALGFRHGFFGEFLYRLREHFRK